MPIRIEPADNPGDVEACCDIWLAASILAHDFIDPEFWRAKRTAMRDMYLPAADVAIAVSGRSIVGFSAMMGERLEALFVHPDCWGRGIGGLLLAEARTCRNAMTLSVYSRNGRALAFYRRHGFVETGSGVCAQTGEAETRMAWIRNPNLS